MKEERRQKERARESSELREDIQFHSAFQRPKMTRNAREKVREKVCEGAKWKREHAREGERE